VTKLIPMGALEYARASISWAWSEPEKIEMRLINPYSQIGLDANSLGILAVMTFAVTLIF